jgi:hypothetical protein
MKRLSLGMKKRKTKSKDNIEEMTEIIYELLSMIKNAETLFIYKKDNTEEFDNYKKLLHNALDRINRERLIYYKA